MRVSACFWVGVSEVGGLADRSCSLTVLGCKCVAIVPGKSSWFKLCFEIIF